MASVRARPRCVVDNDDGTDAEDDAGEGCSRARLVESDGVLSVVCATVSVVQGHITCKRTHSDSTCHTLARILVCCCLCGHLPLLATHWRAYWSAVACVVIIIILASKSNALVFAGGLSVPCVFRSSVRSCGRSSTNTRHTNVTYPAPHPKAIGHPASQSAVCEHVGG